MTLLSTVGVRRGHFRFESGHHSDVWMDLETLCLRPAAIQPFSAALADRLRPYRVDAVTPADCPLCRSGQPLTTPDS